MSETDFSVLLTVFFSFQGISWKTAKGVLN